MTARKKSQSWEDFKREQFGGRTEEICGVTVRVPTDVPYGFDERLQELSDSSAPEDVAELIGALFGPGALDQWVENGIGQMELMTVLTWGMAQASGQDLTFSEAYEALTSDDPGKALVPAPNRAARRASSASTGGRSKRTSSASTASTRTRSRG
ncbi:hypothetical protein ACH44C_33630 [Streptomyces purpureus]|uniref:hypothetical protein n=1 Tax=Streptomyces purpureus TaxID=1951 RepID=UPI003788F18D